jgi:hypothetical protein
MLLSIVPAGTTSTISKLPKSYRHVDGVLEHKCSKCLAWLAANKDIFTVDITTTHGFGSWCRTCNAANTAKWRANNRAATVAQAALRASRNRGAPGTFTAEDRDRLFASYGYTCLDCRRHASPTVKLVADHVVPIALYGSHDIANRQPTLRYM